MTEQDVKAALSDRDALTLTLLGEARGEELEGRLAIACVIRTRAADPKRWADTVKDVCFEPWQFSCWNRNDPNAAQLFEQAGLLVQDHAVRSTFVRDALFYETRWLAEGILSGVVCDRVGGANHYLTRLLWEKSAPNWAKGVSPVALVGRHAFFKL